MNALKAKSS